MIATDASLFGRKAVCAQRPAGAALLASDDVRLFATTFAAGFLFVTMFIA